MIEIGTVSAHDTNNGQVTVKFNHIGTNAICDVLQQSTGNVTTFTLPTIGTQVVCYIDDGINIVLGALFSEKEKSPGDYDVFVKCDEVEISVKNNKIILKNNLTGIKDILNDILNLIQNLTVSTAMGVSGTPLPPTITAINNLTTKINKLLE